MAEPRSAPLFRSLRLRLTLVCTLATGVILVGMALASLAFAQRQLEQSGAYGFRSAVNAILFHVRSQSLLDHTWISQTEAGGNLILEISLSGRPLLYRGSTGGAEREELLALARKDADMHGLNLATSPESETRIEQTEFSFEAHGRAYRAAAATLPLEQGWAGILILQSTEGEAQALRNQRLAFAGFTVSALVLLALFAWRFTLYLLRPLEETRHKQMEFVHAASHELRSPLAVIHASLSAMRGAPPEQAEHFTEMAESECTRMSRLVGDMLTLASADDGTWSICREEVEAETLLLGVYEGYERSAWENGLGLAVVLPEEPLPRCRWDRQRVAQVLSILVENGLSYTQKGGHLCMGVARCAEGIALTVADNGPGISIECRERVFERFYRDDAARTDREHYGLGLCIAREIVVLHRGSIHIEETEGGGSTFVVILPVD